MSAEEIADAIWLANQIKLPLAITSVDEVNQANQISQTEISKLPQRESDQNLDASDDSTVENTQETTAKAYTKNGVDSISQSNYTEKSTSEKSKPASPGVPFKSPAVAALPNALEIGRSLRPLMRKVPSRIKFVLDEENTAQQIAENDVWIPVLKPARERWLDLVIVVEENRATVVWEETINEFRKLMERHGAFRNVYTWNLCTNDGKPQFFHQQRKATKKQRSRSPKELLEPNGRRLILLISDCISSLWWQGEIHNLLELWSKQVSVTILQLLPEQLWERTVLDLGISVSLSAIEPGLLNSQLTIHDFPFWLEEKPNQALKLPIVILEPESLEYWAKVIAGTGNIDTVGILFMPNWKELKPTDKLSSSQTTKDPELLVNKFYNSASPLARRLANLMSSAPVSIPVIHLIQEKMLPPPRKPIILAEIFMSGLLKPKLISQDNQPEKWQYDFVEGVREVLWRSVRLTEIEAMFKAVSEYICQKAGISIRSFPALLFPNSDLDEKTKAEIFPFAEINQQVLRQLGGDYAKLAEQLNPVGAIHELPLPEIKTFEFESAIITENETSINLEPFDFEVATIELKKLGWPKQKTELSIKRKQKQAQQFIEDLGNGIQLEMVAIPGGSFMMGSPKNEPERRETESPQHQVTVPPFLLGKYPVTQAQWQAVAALPPVNQELKPNPSRFEGANRPVERVSWHDAVEFCNRLSNHTQRPYRLPSEAEWEYACRAGTTTPFHFGETITTDLANYNGNYIYGDGVKGIRKGETTEVGSFKIANEFGLYDMHGNVWEWCQDDWHNNYEDAPTDGSAWISNKAKINKLLRGGSWYHNPGLCRSAYRSFNYLDSSDDVIGFRVVCSGAARTL
ncbi:formylglycine-generating enzyme family protein [Dolichospermum lemmermannii CS-548]|uniref:formylglycine-generating enzyme family protein n=1 Tax=Dolichospermum lemmermannii TaxID=54295 RepID=UPI00232AF2B4|nr:formylglycine-generating enzyme family protein [Dolichospermum lemmermannii]MDB9438369.1 formylglycine-generating enzyme family protein [Dolichospermum lemmermannii CS-548]